jgi:RHS repeat-associated protein
MKTRIVRSLSRVLFGALCLLAGESLATSGARSHSWSIENGNMVLNWSFENEFQVWSDSAYGMMYSTVRNGEGPTARSGRFTAMAAGYSFVSEEVVLVKTGKIPVVPGQPYTLSFYVRSDGDFSNGIRPVLRFFSSKGGSPRTVTGFDYSDITDADALPNWTITYVQGTAGPTETFVEVGLWRTAAEGVWGTLYFDDVVLEEGTWNGSQSQARRARHGYSVTFLNEQGQVDQTQTRLPDDPTNYLVEGQTYDSAGRVSRGYLPFTTTNSGSPSRVSDLAYAANSQYTGSPGFPDAGGYPYSEIQYAPEPGARVVKTTAPGNVWRLAGTKTPETGFYFVPDLSIPGNIKNPATDANEREYQLRWSRDEDSAFVMTWTNRAGQVVQSVRKSGSMETVSRMDYYPSGKLRRVRTPLDTSGAAFAQVFNYNAAGQLTSSYTADRGLQKFWYNRWGQLRYTQNDRQALTGDLYTYFEYDALGNIVSTGEQTVFGTSADLANGTAIYWEKTESKGYIYGDISSFESRTGFSLGALDDNLDGSIPRRENTLVAAYHLNPENKAPGLTAQQRLVANFYRYDKQGRVQRSYKYMGALKNTQLRTVEYTYDTLDRVIGRAFYNSGYVNPALAAMKHFYTYDALGRVTIITDGTDTLAQYVYNASGSLDAVKLGKGEEDAGTTMSYGYHIRGWTREILATREGGDQTYRQLLGYEDKALDHADIPSLTAPYYTGQITQQINKYTADIPNPVRVVNYAFDPMSRMTMADYRHGASVSGSDQEIPSTLSLSNVDDLDTRVAYDIGGRILGKRSGGVSSGDSARYTYYGGSYRPEKVQGKLSSSSTRNAGADYNFVYDANGNMTQDFSKRMTIAYAYDGMPSRFELRERAAWGDGLVLHPLYDAGGWQVSLVGAEGRLRGFPTFLVGTAEGSEDPAMYTESTVHDAIITSMFKLSLDNHPAPDSVVIDVVLNEGVEELEDMELEPLMKGDTLIPVVVRGVRKYSAAYDALMAEYTGRKLWARHSVKIGGNVVGEVRETYNTAGTLTSQRNVATIFGRGSPIGRRIITGTDTLTQFYVKNHLGSTVRVVNEDGSFATTPAFDYQPYGELQGIREDSANPVAGKFTGKNLDTTVDLSYFGARWYDAELGMWIGPDPAGQFNNHYGYVDGAVLISVDPNGLWKIGLGISVGWTRKGGWSLGTGIGFEDVNLGFVEINTYAGADYNFKDGSMTYSAAVGGAGCIPPVCVGAGIGGSYNTSSGYSMNAYGSVGLGVTPDNQIGLEIGTHQQWDKNGNYVGGDVYGEAFVAAGTTRTSLGYSHGFGATESGAYARLSAGGLSVSYHTANGLDYGASTRVASASYSSKEGAAYNYVGKSLVEYLTNEKERPLPIEETDGSGVVGTLTGTNYCGTGGGGATTGSLDAACKAHDKAYAAAGVAGLKGLATANAWNVIAADFNLSGSAFQSADSGPLGQAALGQGFGLAFFALGAYKSVTNLTTSVPY